MTTQNPYGRYAVYSYDKWQANFPDAIPAGRYTDLEGAKQHAESVTYKMVVVDMQAESRGFIYTNWEAKQERLQSAMFDTCFPCNPIPFALGLAEYVRHYGSDSIKTDEAKRILWILIAQAYGQLAMVDLCSEWTRLEPKPATIPADGFADGGCEYTDEELAMATAKATFK